MSEEISALLSELSQAGEVDSSGAFTLDIQSTVEKLTQFRLGDPRQYVLNLVSCATARGASWIQAEVDRLEFRLGFDGAAFTRSELHNLFHSVYDATRRDPGCADLALALLGSRAFNPEWMVFETWDGSRGHFVQIFEEQLYIHELPKEPWSAPQLRNCFRLRETPVLFRNYDSNLQAYAATFKYWFERLSFPPCPEIEHLKERCRFGPVPLWINGKRVPLPVSSIANLELIGEGPPPPVMEGKRQGYAAPSPLWGRLQFHGGLDSQWSWIVQGVSFADRNPDGQAPGIHLQVYANHLTLDISQGSLVDNEPLRQARGEIQQLLRPHLEQVCRDVPPDPDGQTDPLRPLRRWLGRAQDTA